MKNLRFKRIAVIGAGTMGPGIAQSFALAKYSVSLFGRSKESCRKGLEIVEKSLAGFEEYGLIGHGERGPALSRIQGVTSLEYACSEVDFVVEAVPENLVLKEELFSKLDEICPADSILASNTSGLSITAIGGNTSRPDKVVGTHFWNPPNLIPLVEVVRGERTSDETVLQTSELMDSINKKPVVVNREVPGFIGTRLHQALIREAFYIIERGIATPEDVDTVVKTSFGRRLAVTGPFETCDLGGLDVFLAAAEVWNDLSVDADLPQLLAERVKQGRLGAKSGSGIFDWDQESVSRIIKERENELIRYVKKDMGLI
jgi:3-hydroxybutyryl-CoA dehydrogenase